MSISLHYIPYLVCPICFAQLTCTGNALACANYHSFDIAREKYVNFLRTKVSGDTKEMLQARRGVFARDHYLPVSDMLNRMVTAHLSEDAKQHNPGILDAGCGEGYYLSRLQAHLIERQISATCLGLDVSKEAVRLAARRNHEAFFLVANLKEQLAFHDQSFQVLLNIFAPRNPAEFARVLAPGGLLLVIIPASTHLRQLRAELNLLDIEANKQQHVVEQFTAQGYFRMEAQETVTYEVHLQGEEIVQLVMMTPNYWHRTEQMLQAASDLGEIHTEIACTCLALRRLQPA